MTTIDTLNEDLGAGVYPLFHVGHRMERALEYAHVSKGEMAEYLGVSPATLLRWMKGTTKPKRHVLLSWAVRCGVSTVWLIDGYMPAGNGEWLKPSEALAGLAATEDVYGIRDLNPEPADTRDSPSDLRRLFALVA